MKVLLQLIKSELNVGKKTLKNPLKLISEIIKPSLILNFCNNNNNDNNTLKRNNLRVYN